MKKLVFLVCFFMLNATLVFADLVSTFDTDMEGWRPGGYDDSVILSWTGDGGNPGGYLSGEDNKGNDWWYFISPTSWAGNWSGYSSLEFDLKIFYAEGTVATVAAPPMVVIYDGDGNKLEWTDKNNFPPNFDWTHYFIRLNAETFGVTENYFNSVISDVKELRIRGEYVYQDDIEGLDNVRVSAVSLPGAIYLLGSGLLGFLAQRKRVKA